MPGQPGAADASPASPGLGAYLYCFARPGARDPIQTAGVHGCGAIETLVVHEVAGVFGQVSLDDFQGAMAEARLQDPAWVVTQACRHEQVIEAVMSCSPVLPLRFGTILSSPQALEELLVRHGPAIAGFLDRAADTEEWAIKVFLDAERAGEWLTTVDSGLAERRRLLSQAPGARYFQEKRLRADALQRARLWGRELAEQVHASLWDMSLEVRALPLRCADNSEAGMIFHAACLVPRLEVTCLRSYAERLENNQREQGLSVHVSGPWPPYHFCPDLTVAP